MAAALLLQQMRICLHQTGLLTLAFFLLGSFTSGQGIGRAVSDPAYVYAFDTGSQCSFSEVTYLGREPLGACQYDPITAQYYSIYCSTLGGHSIYCLVH